QGGQLNRGGGLGQLVERRDSTLRGIGLVGGGLWGGGLGFGGGRRSIHRRVAILRRGLQPHHVIFRQQRHQHRVALGQRGAQTRKSRRIRGGRWIVLVLRATWNDGRERIGQLAADHRVGGTVRLLLMAIRVGRTRRLLHALQRVCAHTLLNHVR